MSAEREPPSISELRSAFRSWLENEGERIRESRAQPRTVETELHHTRWVFGLLWEEGFSRWGWPPDIGGFGGPSWLRAVIVEELALGAYVNAGWFSMPEVLAPAFALSATSQLSGQFVERYLNGTEWWCQGFSEPDAGSDLASLRTRATENGEGFVVNGQKVWTTLAHLAERCVLLARTGPPDSGHRGITAFLMDMDSPGVSVRPLETSAGDRDFCELYLDEVRIQRDRVIGSIGGGWAFAMSVLSCERGSVFWGQIAALYERLDALIAEHQEQENWATKVGSVYQILHSLRARSALTQQKLVVGTFNATESSIDKVLKTTTEQDLYNVAADLLGDQLIFGDTPSNVRWRGEYLYSKAASIYGGTSEIQRNIISEHLLGLPRV